MNLRLLLACWLLAVALAARAQSATSYAQLTRLVSPPGTVFVQDSLWLDEAEVANLHYLEYLHFLRLDSTEAQYQTALPDTTAWRQLGAPASYSTYYLRYPGFRYFPVTGVSYRQAVRYCRWRSAMVNKNLHAAEYLKKHPKLRGYEFRVEYRLPTVREWELAAAGGLDPAQFPYGNVFPPPPGSRAYRAAKVRNPASATVCLRDSTTCPPGMPVFRAGFTVRERYYAGDLSHPFSCPELDEHQQSGSLNDGAMITDYCYAHPPNPRGFYNMIGNVAELTATPGVAKGGSFRHSTKASTVQASFPYAAPQMWLGFRCACTVYIGPKK